MTASPLSSLLDQRPLHLANPQAWRGAGSSGDGQAMLSASEVRSAIAEISTWPGYRPSPLVALPGLAEALMAALSPSLRQVLGLGQDSHVLIIGTEGDTDTAIYGQLTGRRPEEVLRAASQNAVA